jgi:uracil-DNA glycosylase
MTKPSSRPKSKQTAAPLIPAKATLTALRAAASDCKACDLWKAGTQTVFGEGQRKARLMFVGEQPGDREDIAGRPFVGPAGRLLNDVLAEAGIARDDVYVTNVVKHFRWERAASGKRRIHKKPRASEIRACRPWLDAEIAVIRPQVIVCLGATAAQTLIGRDFRVSRDRGKLLPCQLAPRLMATVHPSSILRAPDEAARALERTRFLHDLQGLVQFLSEEKKAA